MMLLQPRSSSWLNMMCLTSALAVSFLSNVHGQDVVASYDTVTLVVGKDDQVVPAEVGWTDGVCYKPVANYVHPGDSIQFNYGAHNVYQMASKQHFMDCNFTDATLLSQVGQSPYKYEIPTDYIGTLYFACQVGDHCASGTQKLQVTVTTQWGNEQELREPKSSYLVGVSTDDCQELQENSANSQIGNQDEFFDNQRLLSECSDPVMGDDGYFTRTCLSGPATLTPGGVINRLFVMHYPYPKDHRVQIGQRTFEFVYDNPGGEGVIAAPVNQLYVHHLSGRIVFGQGAEGIRQEAPDAPMPQPYTVLSGDEGEFMIFHIIDLREVDDWLGCIECRCPISSGLTYFDELTVTGNITGGVNCCSNCTDLTGPTLDYRMRYNVSYKELDEVEPVKNVLMMTADISPAVDKVLEHDVFSWEYLPKEEQAEDNPYIQRLERVEPFNELFKEEFFESDYSGPDEVQLIRCVAHLHVASIDMWLENVETGERLCDGKTTYGRNPETDEGFLIAVNVDTYDPPLTFPADTMVRMVTEYNATQVHTGVMGYWFIFVAGQDEVTKADANLTASICMQPTCDASMLPTIDMDPFQIAPPSNPAVSSRQGPSDECVDTLADSPTCTFGGICDCETFVNAEESSGCNGFYSSAFGDIEVRSVCAKYCGCDVTVAIEDAATASEGGEMAAEEEDCVDTLADNPACTFGGLCDCEAFVNAEESTGCGGVYSSPMGDIEVNSVCAKFCGCEATSAPTEPKDACVDTLADSPSCTFGGLCDCETFVNAEESSGCGGVYSSPMGDIEVNSVCANFCGCQDGVDPTATTEEQPDTPAVGGPPAPSGGGGGPPAPPMGCIDELINSPMCRFAGICECEDFVNAPESEGCGGLYKSDMGNVVINDVCAVYCGECKDRPMEEIFEEAYMEVMTIQMHEKCRFDTPECRAMLSNMYSCASGQPGIEAAHPMIQAVVTKRGQEVAMASAKLGDSSLHAGEEPQDVVDCTAGPDNLETADETVVEEEPVDEPIDKNGPEEDSEPTSAGIALFSGLFATLMMVSTTMFL